MSSHLTLPSRNQPCPCGSGKRYKHCCGSSEAGHNKSVSPPTAPVLADKLRSALQFQMAAKLSMAERLYREALEIDANNVDALHMLGVICMERLRYSEALELMYRVAELTNWAQPQVRHNLGLTLARLMAAEANARQGELLAKHLEWCRMLENRPVDNEAPLVSIIVPSYNHAGYIAEALRSVFEQTYRNLELIVIDDGSTDGSPTVIEKILKTCPFPHRFIARANQGADRTLNEGAELANGKYLNFLNSDDSFAPDRIERMVACIAAKGAVWGFSGVTYVDHEGNKIDLTHPTAIKHHEQIGNCIGKSTNGFAFLEFNPCISSGNIFVERQFFLKIGGFRPLRYNHDWDYCLRASIRSEPVFINGQLYRYRLHSSNTISEASDMVKADADKCWTDYFQTIGNEEVTSDGLSPTTNENRTLFYKTVLNSGKGTLLPVENLRAISLQYLEKNLTAKVAVDRNLTEKNYALIVLGMHRSGTSAFSRVLNLCGAFLPENIMPAKLGNNDKGFWESEEAINLNNRLLKLIGAAWDEPDFSLAAKEQLCIEALEDIATLLEMEYAGHSMILIKDPRICLLASWWDEALNNAGYRPKYIISVRNPLEVAASLEARDNMPLETGLLLWLRYFNEAEAATRNADRVFVTYAALMADWRGCIGKIATALEVALDVETKAAEIDSFLEEGLRRQRFSDESLESYLSHPLLRGVVEKYRWALQQATAMPDN